MSYFFRKKSGRARSGRESGGAIMHIVPTDADPSWEKALCGTTPGHKGNGWMEPEQDPLTDNLSIQNTREDICPKCMEKFKIINNDPIG